MFRDISDSHEAACSTRAVDQRRSNAGASRAAHAVATSPAPPGRRRGRKRPSRRRARGRRQRPALTRRVFGGRSTAIRRDRRDVSRPGPDRDQDRLEAACAVFIGLPCMRGDSRTANRRTFAGHRPATRCSRPSTPLPRGGPDSEDLTRELNAPNMTNPARSYARLGGRFGRPVRVLLRVSPRWPAPRRPQPGVNPNTVGVQPLVAPFPWRLPRANRVRPREDGSYVDSVVRGTKAFTSSSGPRRGRSNWVTVLATTYNGVVPARFSW